MFASVEILPLVSGWYSWPGNVRELRNVVEALVVGSSGGLIRVEDVEGLLEGGGVGIDRMRLEEALRVSGGNKSKAARLLGISRGTLWHWMKTLGLQ